MKERVLEGLIDEMVFELSIRKESASGGPRGRLSILADDIALCR